MSGWRPALRIARREMLRAKGRSLLVLVMVLLPVTAVATMSTLLRTSEVDRVEGLPSTLGAASARLDVVSGRVQQDPLARSIGQYEQVPPPTPEQIRARLPQGARLLEVRERYDSPRLQHGEVGRRVTPVAVDLRDPERRASFRVVAGRAPGDG